MFAARAAQALGLALLLAQPAGACSKKEASKEPKEELPLVEPRPRMPARVPMSDELMQVARVRVSMIDAGQQGHVETKELETSLRKALAGSELFVAEGAVIPAGKVRRRFEIEVQLRYDLAVSDKGAGALLMSVEASGRFVDASDSPEPRVQLLIERGLEAGQERAMGELLQESAAVSIERVAGELVARERLRRSSDGELVSAISDGLEDPGLAAWAIDLAAIRGLSAASDAIVARLGAKEDAVVSSAIAALVRLGNEKHVRPLTELADFNDQGTLFLVMEAVGAIGGEDARAFLEFVSEGHREAHVRDRALELIEEMERRAQKAH